MSKGQVVVLFILVALAFYYLNQEESKPKKSFSEPWIVPAKISVKKEELNSPKTKPTIIPSPKAKSSFEFPSDEPIAEPTESLETDYSWLTDDNLEYILKNWAPIKEALARQNSSQRKFSLRTDIANIYNCFYKAKTNQVWDLPEFLERLEDNKHQYTLFPLRVNGNHWGLFILEETEEPEPTMEPGTVYCPAAQFVVTKVYYTSSGGGI